MKYILKMTMFQLVVLMVLSSCETKKSCQSKFYAPSCESFNDFLYVCNGTSRLPGCHRETVCDNDWGGSDDSESGSADTGGTLTENGDLTDAGVGCTEICVEGLEHPLGLLQGAPFVLQ